MAGLRECGQSQTEYERSDTDQCRGVSSTCCDCPLLRHSAWLLLAPLWSAHAPPPEFEATTFCSPLVQPRQPPSRLLNTPLTLLCSPTAHSYTSDTVIRGLNVERFIKTGNIPILESSHCRSHCCTQYYYFRSRAVQPTKGLAVTNIQFNFDLSTVGSSSCLFS